MPAAPASDPGRLVESPVGPLLVQASSTGLTRLLFVDDPVDPVAPVDPVVAAYIDQAEAELTEYFAGGRTTFDVALDLDGTPFQRAVWAQLRQIPHGATASYGELARKLGSPQASRAVGMANNRNPIAIIVPCHRVIGADGSLTGFGGGLPWKRWLLAREQPQGTLIPS